MGCTRRPACGPALACLPRQILRDAAVRVLFHHPLALAFALRAWYFTQVRLSVSRMRSSRYARRAEASRRSPSPSWNGKTSGPPRRGGAATISPHHRSSCASVRHRGHIPLLLRTRGVLLHQRAAGKSGYRVSPHTADRRIVPAIPCSRYMVRKSGYLSRWTWPSACPLRLRNGRKCEASAPSRHAGDYNPPPVFTVQKRLCARAVHRQSRWSAAVARAQHSTASGTKTRSSHAPCDCQITMRT